MNNEKYITKLAAFANDIINPDIKSCIVIDKEKAKEFIKEIESEYLPIQIIELKLEEEKEELKNIANTSNPTFDTVSKIIQKTRIQLLEELLSRRTDNGSLNKNEEKE